MRGAAVHAGSRNGTPPEGIAWQAIMLPERLDSGCDAGHTRAGKHLPRHPNSFGARRCGLGVEVET